MNLDFQRQNLFTNFIYCLAIANISKFEQICQMVWSPLYISQLMWWDIGSLKMEEMINGVLGQTLFVSVLLAERLFKICSVDACSMWRWSLRIGKFDNF